MARPFSPSTAELVVDAVESVVACLGQVSVEFVSEFIDQPEQQSRDALLLAVELGLLKESGGAYLIASPLCRYAVTPDVDQKAALVRIVLDSYEPFSVFIQRLIATESPAAAAEQTRALLELDAHRGEVKDTLISLGTYAQLLSVEGGGRYGIHERPPVHDLLALATACTDRTEAERVIRKQLGEDAAAKVSDEEVLSPLVDALWRARGGDGDGAVQQAGNAVESFLEHLGGRVGVNLTGANGINAKAQRLQDEWTLPKKLTNVARYLGHIRNAADHGVDSDIGYSWEISDHTALEYAFVSCSFIRAVIRREQGKSAVL